MTWAGATGPVGGLPQGVDALSAVFSKCVGVDADPLPLPGGGYVWFDVQGITPSRDRTLDEAREQVTARWREDQISQRLEAKARVAHQQMKKGEAADLAEGGGCCGGHLRAVQAQCASAGRCDQRRRSASRSTRASSIRAAARRLATVSFTR
ncbi:MAG: hypothetical protein QM771_10980 [Nitrospira sp.]